MGRIELVMTIVVFVVVGLVFAGLVVGAYKLYGRQRAAADVRRAALAEMATAKGYRYRAQAPERVSIFASAPFGLGIEIKRSAQDAVAGEWGGRPFETFAYQYEQAQGNHNGPMRLVAYPYQITWIELPAVLPVMSLTADDARGHLGTTKDLDIESFEFNERWKVWCEDERVGHAILTPALISFLLEPGWVGRGIVIEGNKLMTYAAGHTDLRDLEGVVAGLYGIRDHIPEFLFSKGGLQ